MHTKLRHSGNRASVAAATEFSKGSVNPEEGPTTDKTILGGKGKLT